MAKLTKKEEYDIKEASNPSLSKSARWHYQENAAAGAKDEEHGHHASANKVHRKSRENRANNYNPWESRELEYNPTDDIATT